MDASKIREHMSIVGSDGRHVGTVDHIDGNRIKLTKTDQSAKGQHHYVPLDWIDKAEGQTLRLSKTADEAMKSWQAQPA